MTFCEFQRAVQTVANQGREGMQRWRSGQEIIVQDFPGGTVVKNPPANAGDTGSIRGPGRSHMLWSK